MMLGYHVLSIIWILSFCARQAVDNLDAHMVGGKIMTRLIRGGFNLTNKHHLEMKDENSSWSKAKKNQYYKSNPISFCSISNLLLSTLSEREANGPISISQTTFLSPNGCYYRIYVYLKRYWVRYFQIGRTQILRHLFRRYSKGAGGPYVG